MECKSGGIICRTQNKNVGLTVEIPLDKVAVGNLTKLLDAKGGLIRKALGITDLPLRFWKTGWRSHGSPR